jgi:hypothetical protein
MSLSSSAIVVRQAWAERIAVGSASAANQIVYRHGPALPKPCVHPLTTPRGHVISGFEMSDHVWHRGLWFAIKYVDGVNFWEEQPPFGVQTSAGEPAVRLVSERAARIDHALQWRSAEGGVALREERTVGISMCDEGIGCIDWACALRAERDLLLDRTPYTTWGGYSGLTFRASRQVHQARYILPGGEACATLTGQRHAWVALEGLMDEGVEQRVSVAMFDHPDNPRSPSPWYCKSEEGYVFMNAAFLFHEPMMLKAGQTLAFRYRTFYRDGVWTGGELARLAEEFAGGGR